MNSRVRASTRFRGVMQLLLAAGIVCGNAPWVAAQDAGALLPGELPVKAGRPLIGVSRLPSIQEVIAAARDPKPRVLAVLRLHGDANNHYAPSWSRDGRRMSFLRNDLTLRSCKVLLLSDLGAREPLPLYRDDLSYEHMNRWSHGDARFLAFASNNSADRSEGIHWVASDEKDPVPVTLIEGRGVATLPTLHVAGGRARLVYRQEGELRSLQFPVSDPQRATVVRLGAGSEAVCSPDGLALAVVRGTTESGGQRLLLQEVETAADRLLFDGQNRLVRDPSWSPDLKTIAFYSQAREERSWELWIASATGEPNPRRVASDIRVDENFLHVSPSWTPDSSRIWFVSTRGENGYHPLQWWSRTGETGQAEYPRELTTAANVSVCPDPSRPLIAFIAAGDPAIDVYLALMSHL